MATTYPKKPAKTDRRMRLAGTTFEMPPTKMPEGMPVVTPEPVPLQAPVQEQSWADLVDGASPMHWGEMPDGSKTAGGPIKHSLCPGCLRFDGRECTSSMSETMRSDPRTISCINAKSVIGS